MSTKYQLGIPTVSTAAEAVVPRESVWVLFPRLFGRQRSVFRVSMPYCVKAVTPSSPTP
jgi:hypothetical protein